MNNFHSNGKLLLTGEYVVLDGATALALPTKFGQSLAIKSIKNPVITWKSLDEQGATWFETTFALQHDASKIHPDLQWKNEAEKNIAERLLSILREANHVNPGILSQNTGFEITTALEFPRNWGLGSSSTLINNIAQWFDIDAYKLLKNTFGGSGFDVAAAQNNHPITFELKKDKRTVFTSAFDPEFKDNLFFVHLNKKQNSRASIRHYKKQPKEQLLETIEKISSITHQIIACETLSEFELLLEIHESLISKTINTPKVKTQLFADYPGAVKSLGGWGGDFILATGGEREKDYFKKKGYSVILDYEEMVL